MRHTTGCLYLLVTALILGTLPACATVENAADRARDFASSHPVLTSVAAGFAVGSIALAASHHTHHDQPELLRRPHEPYPCARAPGLCD
jgi:hypothetical protein